MPRGKKKKEVIVDVSEISSEPICDSVSDDVCPNCGKGLVAYVVAGGKRFCCDKCAEEGLLK